MRVVYYRTEVQGLIQESFLDTMCKDHGTSYKDVYYFFKLHNGELKGRGSHKEICDGRKNPLLAWVPYKMILENFAQELNPKEQLSYIAKATDLEREKTELCHFSHTDLVTNITSDLFACIVMIFEDNFYGQDANINALIEIEPLMYELRNITYLPWVNVTTSYKTLLDRTTLHNPSREAKQIYGSIKYSYVEKVHVNVSVIYSQNLNQLPLLFEHAGAVLELNDLGVGGVDVSTKALFGRFMDPRSTVNVEVIGQWAEHRKQFNADVLEYFGYGIKRFRNEIHHGEVTFTRIESAEPVYETPDSSFLTAITKHTLGKKLERLEMPNGANVTESPELDDEEFADSDGHPYPGFYPWFVAGSLVVAAVLLFVIIGMVRAWSKREQTKRYKLAATSAA
ncbi:enolase-binding protein isoform X2 [Eurosta solidaginis]|uniref:enolase-binding protein isoform X2 n=1 Tax=Eurosta solidaginis TaxID=178769 RepID=UPI0035311384